MSGPLPGQEPIFPRSVRIGFRTYRVMLWTPLEAASADRYGEIDHTAAVIRLDPQHGPIQTAATLYHELLHGVLEMAAQPEDADQEQVVGAAANGLALIMLDNPVVRDWLHWALHPGLSTQI